MIRGHLAAAALGLAAAVEAAPYTEVFYPSGELRIQAYLYKPPGDGPFPVVIYNHGAREGRERQPEPFEHIGALFTGAGYAVLVPERRGYGKSDGQLWWQETGRNPSAHVARLEAETDDVLAAVEYLRGVPFADARRLAIVGWSVGGIVTMLALKRSSAFAAAVNQAGAALIWDSNSYVRDALDAAAERSMTPTLFMVAENDRTTVSVRAPAHIYGRRGVPYRLMVYEAFSPPAPTRLPPGHALFSEQGLHLWGGDVVQFLDRYLRSPAR